VLKPLAKICLWTVLKNTQKRVLSLFEDSKLIYGIVSVISKPHPDFSKTLQFCENLSSAGPEGAHKRRSFVSFKTQINLGDRFLKKSTMFSRMLYFCENIPTTVKNVLVSSMPPFLPQWSSLVSLEYIPGWNMRIKSSVRRNGKTTTEHYRWFLQWFPLFVRKVSFY